MLTGIERTILGKLYKFGAKHSRHFHVAKAVVARLVSRGFVERFAATPGGHAVYVRITPVGAQAYADTRPEPPRHATISIPQPANEDTADAD